MLKKYKFEIFLIFLLIINFYLIYLVFGFEPGGDGWGYIKQTEILAGDPFLYQKGSLQDWGRAFLRPLGPIIGALFLPLTNNAFGAVLLQNLIFYLLTPFLFFYAAHCFFKQKRLAFYSTVFYICAYPYLKFTLNYMFDIGAWFFIVLSILFTLKYLSVYKTDKKTANNILLFNPVVCFLGFLMKESGGLGIGFFILVILLATDFTLKEKIKKILIPIFLFSILLIFYEVAFYSSYHYYSFDFFSTISDTFPRTYNFSNIAKKLIAVFSLGWFYVVLGTHRIFKEKDRRKMMILLALIPISFSFLFWSYQAERLMYVAGPLLAFLAVIGINIKRQGIKYRLTESLLIILFIAFNYLIDYLISNFDILSFL